MVSVVQSRNWLRERTLRSNWPAPTVCRLIMPASLTPALPCCAVVISFGVGVLGAWTALILGEKPVNTSFHESERLLFTQLSKASSTASAVTSAATAGWRCPPSRSVLALRAGFSASTCPQSLLGIGVCGVWSSFCINLAALGSHDPGVVGACSRHALLNSRVHTLS